MTTLTLAVNDFEWLCREATISADSRMRQAMRLRHVEGDTDQAIAAEMGITVSAVRSHISQGWAKVEAYLTGPRRAARLAELVAEAQVRAGEAAPESYRSRAGALLQAMKGPQDRPPEAPVMDDNGRKAANHDPLVDVWDAERVIGLGDLAREIRNGGFTSAQKAE